MNIFVRQGLSLFARVCAGAASTAHTGAMVASASVKTPLGTG